MILVGIACCSVGLIVGMMLIAILASGKIDDLYLRMYRLRRELREQDDGQSGTADDGDQQGDR